MNSTRLLRPIHLIRKTLRLPSHLCLDSPLVYVAWLWHIADRFAEKSVSPAIYLAGFCAVWAIYLADRLLDVRACRNWEKATSRLKFARKFQPLFIFALLGSLGTGIALVALGKIPTDVIHRAVWVGLGVAIYFLLFVLPPFFRRKKWPGKEFGVGLVVALGIGVALGFEKNIAFAMLAFGLAVTFNCFIIAARDRDADAANDAGAVTNWWPKLMPHLGLTGMFCAVTCQFLDVYTATLAFLLMTILHHFFSKSDSADFRAWADFCLLAPIGLAWLVGY